MKQKLAVLLLVLCMALVLTACDGKAPADSGESALPQSAASAPTETPEISAPAEVGNILIAYFTADENREVDAVTSASLTTVDGTEKGRVRAVADMIAAETGGTLFSIQTSARYPSDGGELIDYAAEEQDQNARPELISQIENLEEYDIIFIGYPTWWYDMPQVLYSFFDTYDFSGKTIIPFNVHNGSRFSGTISTIQELEPDAVVIEDGFTVSEKTVVDAGADVTEWLRNLGF